jgi:hypothetical protein
MEHVPVGIDPVVEIMAGVGVATEIGEPEHDRPKREQNAEKESSHEEGVEPVVDGKHQEAPDRVRTSLINEVYREPPIPDAQNTLPVVYDHWVYRPDAVAGCTF